MWAPGGSHAEAYEVPIEDSVGAPAWSQAEAQGEAHVEESFWTLVGSHAEAQVELLLKKLEAHVDVTVGSHAEERDENVVAHVMTHIVFSVRLI